MSYCTIHGSYNDTFNDGCRDCQLAEDELRSEVSHAAYKSANPGDHECPHCRYTSLKAGASRCPLCHGQVGSDYWIAEAERQDARKAAAVVADREAVAAKRSSLAADRVAFDRATQGIRVRLLALAFIVGALWWGLRQYEVWLPGAHPKYVSATLAVLSQYVGATLGAALVFIALAFAVPRFSREGLAAVAIFLLYAVELSQLYPAQWIDDIRVTWLGGLFWGNGFRWSHLLCYTIGVIPLAEENELPAFGRLLVTLLCIGGAVALWQFTRS
jgi:hypothetical protein